jgi:Glycosyl-transferase for dystroglycan
MKRVELIKNVSRAWRETYLSLPENSYLQNMDRAPSVECIPTGECYEVFSNVLHTLPITFPDDLTLCTIASMDKLSRLVDLAASWEGILSVTIFSLDNVKETIHSLLLHSLPQYRMLVNIVIPVPSQNSTAFPINKLRNIAIKEATSDLVFNVDVDFITSDTFYWRTIRQRSSRHIFSNSKERHIFVVPAFEFTSKFDGNYPITKERIVSLCDKGMVQLFHPKGKGHILINFDKWKESRRPYYINWERWFEPYFIGRRSAMNTTEWYDERFVDRGRNKVVLPMQLALEGFRFVVLHDVFLIHSREENPVYLPGMKGRKELHEEIERTLLARYNCSMDEAGILQNCGNSSATPIFYNS